MLRRMDPKPETAALARKVGMTPEDHALFKLTEGVGDLTVWRSVDGTRRYLRVFVDKDDVQWFEIGSAIADAAPPAPAAEPVPPVQAKKVKVGKK